MTKTIIDKNNLRPILRKVTAEDQELIRDWKNKHSHFFFHKDKISSDQQKQWFDDYSKRPDDHLFIVQVNTLAIGCIGIRLIENKWDLYNVIRGIEQDNTKGRMSSALHELLKLAQLNKERPITLKVLINNPAYEWYKKNKFHTIEKNRCYFVMRYLPEP